MCRYLTTTLAYDRAAIMRSAWANARHYAKLYARKGATLRGEMSDALKQAWSRAKSERSYALWAAEQDAGAAAEAARRAALPLRDRQIEDARYAMMLAEHNDTMSGHRLVAEARARLRSLELTA